MSDKNLFYKYGKRNRLCYFISEIKKIIEDYPEEAPKILKAAVDGTLDNEEDLILKKFENIITDYNYEKEENK